MAWAKPAVPHPHLSLIHDDRISEDFPQVLAVSEDQHARGHQAAHEEDPEQDRAAATHVASSFPPEGHGLVWVAAPHSADA